MIAEPFVTGDSLIHRIDPRVRVITATAFSFTVAVSASIPALSAAGAVSVILVLMARLDLRKVAGRLTVLLGFLLLLWIVLPFTSPGDTAFYLGPFPASQAGIDLALRITLKSVAILLALIPLLATMTLATLGHTLGRLGMPDKMVHLLLMTYRYVFVFETEYNRLLRAAGIRGFRPGTNLHTYRTYAWVVGMLFVRAWDRAERVHNAMRCRGFDGRFHSLHEFPPHRRNWVFSAAGSGVILLLILMELTHNTRILF